MPLQVSKMPLQVSKKKPPGQASQMVSGAKPDAKIRQHHQAAIGRYGELSPACSCDQSDRYCIHVRGLVTGVTWPGSAEAAYPYQKEAMIMVSTAV